VGAKADLQRLAASNAPTASTTETVPTAPTTPQAQYAMGSNYRWGREGVGMDYQKALYWFQLAADQGYSDAEFEVGWFYENGLSVGKDNDRAKVWYQKAADQGNLAAQAALERLVASNKPTPSISETTPPRPPRRRRNTRWAPITNGDTEGLGRIISKP
jgi:TPR repeat protein